MVIFMVVKFLFLWLMISQLAFCSGWRTIHEAYFSDASVDTIDRMLRDGHRDYGNVVWFSAVLDGRLNVVQALTNGSRNRYELLDSLCPFYFGVPAVACAVGQGHVEILRFLLEVGADPEYRDGHGRLRHILFDALRGRQ